MSKNSVVTFKIADKNATFYTHLSSKIKLLLGRSSTDFRISNKLDIKLNKTLIKKISLKIEKLLVINPLILNLEECI